MTFYWDSFSSPSYSESGGEVTEEKESLSLSDDALPFRYHRPSKKIKLDIPKSTTNQKSSAISKTNLATATRRSKILHGEFLWTVDSRKEETIMESEPLCLINLIWRLKIYFQDSKISLTSYTKFLNEVYTTFEIFLLDGENNELWSSKVEDFLFFKNCSKSVNFDKEVLNGLTLFKIACFIELKQELSKNIPKIKINKNLSEQENIELNKEDTLAKLFNNKLFSDVKLELDGNCIFAHKAVLATSSSILKRLFDTMPKDDYIFFGNYNVFFEMIRYIYTGNLNPNISSEMILELLILSEKYSIKNLKCVCEKILSNNITTNNMILYVETAYTNNADILKKSILDKIKMNKSIVKEKEFEIVGKKFPHFMYQVVQELAEE